MVRLVLAAILACGLWLPASAQSERNSDIENTIQSQIEAFQIDDFVTAFGFSSPSIRRIFGNPANFGIMVRRGFPMVWRPGSVKYLDLRQNKAGGVQKVLIRDVNGVFHTLEYDMIRVAGGWLINGVQLLSPPEIGA